MKRTLFKNTSRFFSSLNLPISFYLTCTHVCPQCKLELRDKVPPATRILPLFCIYPLSHSAHTLRPDIFRINTHALLRKREKLPTFCFMSEFRAFFIGAITRRSLYHPLFSTTSLHFTRRGLNASF